MLNGPHCISDLILPAHTRMLWREEGQSWFCSLLSMSLVSLAYTGHSIWSRSTFSQHLPWLHLIPYMWRHWVLHIITVYFLSTCSISCKQAAKCLKAFYFKAQLNRKRWEIQEKQEYLFQTKAECGLTQTEFLNYPKAGMQNHTDNAESIANSNLTNAQSKETRTRRRHSAAWSLQR